MNSGSNYYVIKFLFQLQFYFVKWVYIFSSNLTRLNIMYSSQTYNRLNKNQSINNTVIWHVNEVYVTIRTAYAEYFDDWEVDVSYIFILINLIHKFKN